MEFDNYFQSYNDYFWQYEDHGEVISIPEGSTIAYREFVIEIFEKLSPQGVPPFGSLLLGLIATNPDATGSIDKIKEIVGAAINDKNNYLLLDAMAFLKILSEVPENYKQGEKRTLLLQAIFENCHNIMSVANTKRIFAVYNSKKRLIANKKDFSRANFVRDLKCIAILGNKFPDVKSIIEKIAGLPFIPTDIVELEKSDVKETEPGDLVEELIENDKTFHVGALVKRIWSGLNIPFHNTTPSQQPMGGVSDLTNKGDFDRLLISEFANDDLIFLSRLANNEALYFNREIPPMNNDLKRIILIDVSVKNWGTPKTIAFALMVAIAKHPKSNINCEAFAVGKSFDPVSFESVDNIIEGLQILDGCLHSAEGLELFFKEHGGQKNVEVLYISTLESIKYPPVQKVISENYSEINYWMHTNAEGDISLFKKQNNSKKHLSDIRLPLDDLWKKETRTGKVPEKRTTETQTEDYPILFRNPISAKRTLLSVSGEVYKLTSERNLLRFYDKDVKFYEKGWEMVRGNLPFTSIESVMGQTEEGEDVLLMFNIQRREIVLINLYSGVQKNVFFNEWRSSAYNDFIFSNGLFYYLTHSNYWTIDVKGNITRVDVSDESLKEIYKKKKKEQAEADQKHAYAQGIFKNINTVFINRRDNLVFNIHELYVNDGGSIKLEVPGTKSERHLTATGPINNVFTFHDNSTITVDRAGMLILRSSNPLIPEIYVPSAVEGALGVATESAFAGNLYYFREPNSYNVFLREAGPNKLAAIRAIREANNKGLKEIKDMVEGPPSSVMERTTKEKAWKLKADLYEVGAFATIDRTKENKITEVEKIGARQFFDKYINAFIKHIKEHGNRS